MYPFYNNTQGFPLFPINPFFPGRRTRVPTLDNRGIYEVCTTDMVVVTGSATEADNVTYGINPHIWRSLPNECIILWKVRHPITADGQDLPVTVAVPTSGSASTVSSSSSNSSSNTKKVSVVDNKSTQTVGSDITNEGTTTEHLVYIDKCSDTFKLLGVQAAAPTPVS